MAAAPISTAHDAEPNLTGHAMWEGGNTRLTPAQRQIPFPESRRPCLRRQIHSCRPFATVDQQSEKSCRTTTSMIPCTQTVDVLRARSGCCYSISTHALTLDWLQRCQCFEPTVLPGFLEFLSNVRRPLPPLSCPARSTSQRWPHLATADWRLRAAMFRAMHQS